MKTCDNCACDPVCDHNWNGWETCGNWIQKPGEPPTNADRIRAMSDEELALQFGANCPKENRRACDRVCSKCWLEWLRQPAEEGT